MQYRRILSGLVFLIALAPAFAQSLSILPNSSQASGVLPKAPSVSAKAYILIDSDSGKIIAEKNADTRLPPASLTKMMTMYIVSQALRSGQITLEDEVSVSRNAWKMGGSKMFLKEGQKVKVSDLIKGIIVQSGNDACVAMAEYIAGNQKTFSELMNQQAQALGMQNSHFNDPTGWPNPKTYSTPQDMAVLARALIHNFPEDYAVYQQKWFTFNGIRQPNRNRLLWRDPTVDGIKTGHTDAAGYCLVSSAKRDNMRLIGVVMGSPDENTRAVASKQLLTYGFRFFETDKLYSADKPLSNIRIWQGQTKSIPVGVKSDVHITIPRGQYKNLSVKIIKPNLIKAPITQGERIGSVQVRLNDKLVTEHPIFALTSSMRGNIWVRVKDAVGMKFSQWFGGES